MQFPSLHTEVPCAATLGRHIRGTWARPTSSDLRNVVSLPASDSIKYTADTSSVPDCILDGIMSALLPADSLPLGLDMLASRTSPDCNFTGEASSGTLWDVCTPCVLDHSAALMGGPCPAASSLGTGPGPVDDDPSIDASVATAMSVLFDLGPDVMSLALAALSRPPADAEGDLLGLLGVERLDVIATALTQAARMRGLLAAAVRELGPSTGAAAVPPPASHAARGADTACSQLTPGVRVSRAPVVAPGGSRARRAVASQERAVHQMLRDAGVTLAAQVPPSQRDFQVEVAAPTAPNPADLPANAAMLDRLKLPATGPEVPPRRSPRGSPPGTPRSRGTTFPAMELDVASAVPTGAQHVVVSGNEWVTIPPVPSYPVDPSTLVPMSRLPPWSRPAFHGMRSLNVVQSTVFPAVFGSGINVLVSAPTGAGKTGVALLAVLREVGATLGFVERGATAGHGTTPGGANDDVGDDGDDIDPDTVGRHVAQDLVQMMDELDDDDDAGPGAAAAVPGDAPSPTSEAGTVAATPARTPSPSMRSGPSPTSKASSGRPVAPAQTAGCGKLGMKVVYVAPMKALACEVRENFSSRLQSYGLCVREVTGDTDVSRAELDASDVIITTPEKFDLITRKPSYETFVRRVALLLLDEVHILHDDRGSVVEALVARIHTLVEAQQRSIRIVALSATLPNPVDVARFLNVTPNQGLFVFPAAFRPVPLRVQMIGLKSSGGGGGRPPRFNDQAADEIAYERAAAFAREGHGVMVFVHSRKATISLLERFRVLAERDPLGPHPFSPAHCAASASTNAYGGRVEGASAATGSALLQKHMVSIQKCQIAELRRALARGMGAHHAGMQRPDRLLVERLFRAGVLRLLVCTSTLAWGVNLPAHAVIIRGTDVFKTESGTPEDLSMLDVLQIFGRAGRPQYDTQGEACLITATPALSRYLSIFGQQSPIESRMMAALPDHLNAEVVLSNIPSVTAGASWLAHSFWAVRAKKEPRVYGISSQVLADDPELGGLRRQKIEQAAERLDDARMVRYDRATGTIASTELGRIAAHYYVTHATMNVWSRDETLLACKDLGRCLQLVAHSDEFARFRIRDDEEAMLKDLTVHCRFPPRFHSEKTGEGAATVDWKVNILLQVLLSGRGSEIQSHSMKCELNYVAKQAPRLVAALFQVALYRGMRTRAILFHQLALAVEKEMWPTQHPLRQFPRGELPTFILDRLEAAKCTVQRILDLDASEVGNVVRSGVYGRTIRTLAERLPAFEMSVTARPVTATILRVHVAILPTFRWGSGALHGGSEACWLLVGDTDSDHMYHCERVVVTRRTARASDTIDLHFSIGVLQVLSSRGAGALLPSHYTFTLVPERWLGVSHRVVVPTRNIVVPQTFTPYTPLHRLAPLPTAALPDRFQRAFGFRLFNPIQTQIFHTVFNTDANVLVGAPTGSGKTVAADLAVLRLWQHAPQMKAVYIAPLKSLVRERMEDWKRRLHPLGLRVVELTGESSADTGAVESANVIITVPEKWDGLSRGWAKRRFVRDVGLLILDEVHIVGSERGAILEVIVSRARRLAVAAGRECRMVAMSTAVANASDMAAWLDVLPEHVFNFKPHVRPVPMTVHIRSFPGEHYCPRMDAMNPSVFRCITEHGAGKPALVFVSSRRQTRLTAFALRDRLLASGATCWGSGAFAAVAGDVGVASSSGARRSQGAYAQLGYTDPADGALADVLPFGLGIHHAGLCLSDKQLVEGAFRDGHIGVLVATATLAWGVNLPAHLVVIKGTEYFDGRTGRYVDFEATDVLQMMGRAGRPQYDTSAVSAIFVHEPKKAFYKKFLYEPFPVESQLHKVLAPHVNAEIASGTVASRSDLIEYLSFTYLFRRLPQNPSFYGVEMPATSASEDGDLAVVRHALADQTAILRFLGGLVDGTVAELLDAGCITAERPLDDEHGLDLRLQPLTLGRVASFYYLEPRTVATFGGTVSPDLSAAEALALLADAREFDEVPVRHNEDILNAQLADSLGVTSVGEDDRSNGSKWDPLDLPTPAPQQARIAALARLPMESPHTKARLLLLAHIHHATLPMQDYVTDTKSVLDNAGRVLQALVDVVCDRGYLCAALRTMRLSQCLVQGRSLNASPLLQLHRCTEALAAAVPIRQPLATLLQNRESVAANINSVHAGDVSTRRAVGAAFVRLPLYAMDVTVDVNGVPVLVDNTNTTSGTRTAAAAAAASEGRDGELPVVRVKVTVRAVSGDPFFLSSNYVREGTLPSGWVVLGDTAADDLVAVSRWAPRRSAKDGAHVTPLEFEWDGETFGDGTSMKIFFVSDTYAGVDVATGLL
eukprot:TRINITY_DN5927_c0_g1_i1.p1 TRINITY_DN5927_c0_g1~~TRINITY_DN5927_c0_g1_i1.p1  ORF type:complete len:2313 (-),score=404.58 TRINITY_DN5927_c0_g1_i1:3397-10335(-)